MEGKVFVEKKKFLIRFVPTIICIVSVFLCAWLEYIELPFWFYSHIHTEYCITYVDYEKHEAGEIFTEEDYETKKDVYPTFSDFIAGEYAKLPNKAYYDDLLNCSVLVCGGASEAFVYCLREYFYYYLIPVLYMLLGFAIATISYLIIKSTCYNFIVCEENIYGKKGLKKFNIAYSDINEINKNDKSMEIVTAKTTLKLSLPKNCEEVFNLIKPHVAAKVTEQITSAVDDIKLF